MATFTLFDGNSAMFQVETPTDSAFSDSDAFDLYDFLASRNLVSGQARLYVRRDTERDVPDPRV